MLYAITDLETTGGSIKNSKITEISIFLTDGYEIIDEFTSLVNPERPIPYFISQLTGINDEMVDSAPKFYEIAKEIIEFIGDAIFVAHNVGFDYNVLRSEYRSLGYEFRKEYLCTVKSSRQIIPGHASYSLGKLTNELGISLVGRHRARGDALATVELFHLLVETDNNKLETNIQSDLIPKHLHPGLDYHVIEDLPKDIGIYRFYDEHNKLIYIGKSKNIRSRVQQHLKNTKSKKAINMSKEIVRVEYELTGSETIALIHESNLIKKYKPPFNRQLRKDKFPYGLFTFEDGNAYINLHLDLIKNRNTPPITTFFNKKEGVNFLENAVINHQLCKKLVGLYPTKTACFQYHTKECKGACIGEESPAEYNLRVEELLNRMNFELDNFFIVDRGRNQMELGLILIEKGTFIGFGYLSKQNDDGSIKNWKECIDHYPEDRDIRMIISRMVRIGKGIEIRKF
ncbi:exonuclease domain-containing protein [Brumimicrobium aurantiacum]|uniref:Excinuclease cho n=1 Tax=Brumimicrobium aurantiacum TaxID=1737063 RepID=A0A3E1EWM6_9FLAO|nr:exonuclease domain-containing protein [Brumimicrobium aurantiacum]RFC53893.1 exonuclease [Brumimicrobium aurantiacum]